MANIMGGDITVTSTVGEGSTFTFVGRGRGRRMERRRARPRRSTPRSETASALNVLVVEDHPVNRMILEAWLGSAGHATASAENGQIAVDMARPAARST